MSSSEFYLRLRQPRVLVPGRATPDGGMDLVVEPGRRTVLMGRSGAGKTLLARLALGQLPRSPVRAEGTVELRVGGASVTVDLASAQPGTDVACLAALRGDVLSFVPQGGRENLVPGWTVRDHFEALLPVDSEGGADAGPDAARLEQAIAGMESLGVSGSAENLDAVATELSEGMIRRILVALSLARGAQVLIIDEPTTGLDPVSRDSFRKLLDENLLASGAGVLLITHDVGLSKAVGGETLLVDEGVIVARTEDLGAGEPPFDRFVHAAQSAEGVLS
ncbi:MAG TPA: hypothetical protein DIU15_03050 [Deltaproteobacteria bacterium]|nr:hypothetical protein [Deltaproteobacteria bacterium]HCP44988.1 hypothetical protein [Deltaproteobacteria bacterium]